MNRIAVFAHYDKDSCIEDYVVYYLKELKKIANIIIFVSDCDLTDEELQKISGIADRSIAKKHGEYDFGSYKRGYQYLKEAGFLTNCEELIFSNDSCFGPLVPFKEVWNEMDTRDCDFWGITQYEDKNTRLHVQSYFLVFRKTVVDSHVLDHFINSVKHENCKMDVIQKYEIGLSQTLLKNNFKMQTFCTCDVSPEVANAAYLLRQPPRVFVKAMLIKNNFHWLTKWILNKLWLYMNINYNLQMITDYALRFNDQNILRKVKNLKRAIFRPKIIKNQVYIFGKKYRILPEISFFIKK